jgi:hypothetical protein
VEAGSFDTMGRQTMRMMIKFAFPVEAGNTAIRSGKVERVFKQIMEELKPEAAYFFPEGGERAGLFVVDMTDSSQVADTAERFFFGLNARIEMVPVMSAEDLQKGLSNVERTIQRYGDRTSKPTRKS